MLILILVVAGGLLALGCLWGAFLSLTTIIDPSVAVVFDPPGATTFYHIFSRLSTPPFAGAAIVFPGNLHPRSPPDNWH